MVPGEKRCSFVRSEIMMVPEMTPTLAPCDRVRISVLDENYIDMLATDTPTVRRMGMSRHFDPKAGTPLAENGISLLIEVELNGQISRILLDAGLTARVVMHNADLLGIDMKSVDHVMLSHGHPDHFGGIQGVLREIGHPVPLVIHPDAFDPRYINHPSGQVMRYINLGLTKSAMEEAGARLVLNKAPLIIAPGVMVSGEIPRVVDFERDKPGGRIVVRDGQVVTDPIGDYQALIINLRGHGLIVLDMCGHAGVVNSVLHAQNITGVDQVHALIGGFHLGHVGVARETIDLTVERLGQLGIRHIAPMHCSGIRAQMAVATQLPDAFMHLSVGSVVDYASSVPSLAGDA
jgi:7,8-dihydropterin-6-yl-methyl-4-(beta-D-ribofuranosyl)aminobenzene 5'-phosphate synthase